MERYLKKHEQELIEAYREEVDELVELYGTNALKDHEMRVSFAFYPLTRIKTLIEVT